MTQRTESNEQMEQSLIDIAVESWRFSRLFGKVVSKLDAGESGRYANQLRYFQKKVEESLESNGLKLVNVEGQPFDPGMAASALNVGDFGPDDVLLVDQMVEPIIIGAKRPAQTRHGNAEEGGGMKYVGIDLGTTNSAISSFDGEKIQPFKSPEQHDVTSANGVKIALDQLAHAMTAGARDQAKKGDGSPAP